ncbi:LacI family DNA-binding transcriptional regulator [Phenylobacterium sp. LjRoot219]|uniref:LacI family DNA-binding transcriptional regulator n=1 Tax=Phenylobacterium sp. LjRoot219 TaxID=3342283 RepID=UPI003ECF5A28
MSKRLSPPSAHDVARLAGVSQAAVSRAFTPGASIATATRDKVFEAAKELGYRPNLLARSLIKGQSGIVGVVVGNPRYPFFQAALNALSSRLSQAGKHILIYTAEENATVDAHVEDLLKYRVDAVLLMAASLSPRQAEQCQAEGVPVISLGRSPLAPGSLASVVGDSAGGAAKIAEHLLQQGYRRLALIAGSPDTSSSREREAGFVEHLAARGLPAPARAVGYFRREAAFEAARSLLAQTPRPDALFCINDDMALAAIEVARFEFGLEIGRELGVAGFDDIELAAWPSFDLTTYSLPVDQLIEKTVAILLDEAAAAAPASTIVHGALKIRGSTRRD